MSEPHSPVERDDLIDVTVPHSARVYDYWLGGKQNYEVDRVLAEQIIRFIPTIQQMARENRAFMHRAIQFLAGDCGIGQFLDVGTGVPTRPNLHETAQAINPTAHVVYVDNDPIVLAHARALLVSHELGRTAYIHASLAEPRQILSDPALLKTLDLDRPVALTVLSVLMSLTDEQDPWGCMRELMDALPSGSYVGISHAGHDFDPEALDRNRELAARGGATFVPRVREDVMRFFGDWKLVEPGLVPMLDWRPTVAGGDSSSVYYWAGVAHKS